MTIELREPVATTEAASEELMSREGTFITHDGTSLFYRSWLPAAPVRTAVVLFHRGHEHSGRFDELVKELVLPDVAFFAWDARGHGRSPGERGYAPDFACIVRDADCFVRHISREHGIATRDLVVLGHSVGAVVVAAWVHDHAPQVAGMVLVTPAFRVKLYVPLALPALRGRMLLGGKSFIKSYVRAKMLTHDPRQIEAYQNDPLISRSIATNILLDLHDTSTRLLDDAGAIMTPTLVLSSGRDWVVKNGAQRKFFERLSSPVKRMEVFEDAYHALLHERERERPIAVIRQFIRERLGDSAEPVSLLAADRQGYTQCEFDRLSRPPTVWAPRRWGFALQRGFMKSMGLLSKGIRIGWRCGFDSGESLDYVYRNRASGIAPLGKLIDYFYLNAIGWRGVRMRKANLIAALEEAIGEVQAAGEPVRIVDIASGPGRYLLETMQRFRAKGVDITALLRDRSEPGLAAGRALAEEMGLGGSVTFAAGDAFDGQSLAEIQPKPKIAIVSGLYELFADNQRVLESLRGLYRALSPGGFLIYTNQPWHPQVEMIARVLINRDGKPWIMRRRTQAEMDQLAAAAGFQKAGMRIDRYGIFTVSIAREEPPPQPSPGVPGAGAYVR
jgi:alpha-beta hydrolase superfamily lysophospholipase/SAM-dependent methyltransferase